MLRLGRVSRAAEGDLEGVQGDGPIDLDARYLDLHWLHGKKG